MGESGSTPQVQFEIDQEIFLDSVSEGTVIEDAAVSTEVTLFERVGDAYVLEGAIVFAGYARSSADRGDGILQDDFDVLSLERDAIVNHFHHRLPFILRVPVKAQPKGIVNVNSRIASWDLQVISEGWIRIRGDLTLIGLNVTDGYHFECGPQEEGDLLFQVPWEETAQGRPHGQEDGLPDEVTDVHSQDEIPTYEFDNENEFQDIALVQGLRRVKKVSETDKAAGGTETGHDSAARNGEKQTVDEELQNTEVRNSKESESGFEPDTPLSMGEMRSVDTPQETPRAETGEGTVENEPPAKDFTSEALQKLDRLFGRGDNGKIEAGEVDRSAAVQHVVQPAAKQPEEDRKTVRGLQNANREENVAEFDFQHQVDLGDPNSLEEEAVRDSVGYQQNSWTHPEVVVSERHSSSDTTDIPDSIQGNERNMWSFVDFNQPETTYTLRYIIVTQEETIEDIAVRMQCSRDELIRVNHLGAEAMVHIGQSLMVPETEKM